MGVLINEVAKNGNQINVEKHKENYRVNDEYEVITGQREGEWNSVSEKMRREIDSERKRGGGRESKRNKWGSKHRKSEEMRWREKQEFTRCYRRTSIKIRIS